MKTKFLTLFLALVAGGGTMFAGSIKLGNWYYNFNTTDKTASISYGGNQFAENIVIPSTVTYNSETYIVTRIGENAFVGNSYVVSITIPNSVVSIGEGAFWDCCSLTTITIPNSVKRIGNAAFYGCNKLASVHISDIASWCGISFSLDTSYPNSNPLMYARYLYLNGNLVTDLVIPDSVTSIEDYAFYNCDGLTSVYIPSSVTSVGKKAFCGCDGLTSIEIPNNVTSIGDFAFYSCKNLVSVSLDAEAIANKNYTSGGSLNSIFGTQVQKYIIGEHISSIGDYAFSACSGLTSIEIPNSVTNIGEDAFKDCSNLTAVYISDIEAWCGISFSCNTYYTSSSRPYSNPLLYARYLYLNGNLVTDLVIPNSVTSIGEYAFYNCDGLTSVYIPNSVTSVGYRAFDDCSSLTAVYISDIEAWCRIAFDGPSSNPLLYARYLYLNGNLVTDLVIPNGVTSIGHFAFCGCTGLLSVTIPNSITSIGWDAFRECSSLSAVHISDLVAWCKVAFGLDILLSEFANPLYNAHNLYLNGELITNLIIPDSVTSIGNWVFSGCSSLTSVTIPNSVKSIGEYAFYDCNAIKTVVWDVKNIPDYTSSDKPFKSAITSFTFGENVEYIPAYLCDSLGEQLAVTSLATTPPTLGNNVFSSSPAHIYVPCGSMDRYKVAAKWSTYASSIEYGPLPFKITITPSDSGQVTLPPTMCDEMVLTANPYNGYAFSQWSDGNTDNPRAIELTQDTSFTALYVLAKSGTCGKNMALTWEYDDESKTLTISGNGALNSNYTYGYEAPQNMTRLVLGEGITSIGQNAFENCINLKSVTLLSDALVNKAYSYNSNIGTIFGEQIEEYVIGEDVTSIGRYAFFGCNSLTSVTIGNNVTSIGSFAFENCDNLTSITIGSGVTSIEYTAFYGCSNLKYVTLYSNAIVSKAYSSNSNIGTIFGKQIKEYVIGEDITSIGNYAFSSCDSLTSVTIGASVTSIGERAFSGCTGLTSVTIGNSVTSIGERAFSGCTGLTTIDIPNSVTCIGNRAFADCDDLSYVSIGNGVTSIGELAFYSCSSLTSVTIGNSVTSIGDKAFAYCKKLTSVSIPDSVTSIGQLAFGHCIEMAYVTIGNSVTSIGDEAFTYCKRLTSVTIPDSVTSIGEQAFSYCEDLTNLIIGNNVTSIGKDAFDGCYNMTSLEWNAIQCADLSSVTLPGTISTVTFGKDVKTIPAYLCYEMALTSVIIPNSVIRIGESAFSGCTGLTTVDIPNSVTSIPKSAFYQCRGLNSITIGSGVTSIGDFAFAGCDKLTSVTIPDDVTKIGKRAFYGCTSLTSVTIGNNLTSIGDEAFCNCNVFEALYVPCGKLEDYKRLLPAGCISIYKLKYLPSPFTITAKESEFGQISFPKQLTICDEQVEVTAIPIRGYKFVKWADGNTENPRTIELTQDTTMEAIYELLLTGKCGKDNMLKWTYSPSSKALNISGNGELSENYTYGQFIESVTMDEGVTSIGDLAFIGCGSLSSVAIPSSVTSIGVNAFGECSNLTSVEIPNSVTSIGDLAFTFCSGLTSITLGNGVKEIGFGAFAGCNLVNIIIPEQVKVIGYGAFSDNFIIDKSKRYPEPLYDDNGKIQWTIKTITCYRKNPPRTTATEYASVGMCGQDFPYSSTILYVQAGSIEIYEENEAWGDFDVRPIEATEIEATDLQVTPTTTSASVVWPSVSGAATYELVIKDKDGNVICTLIFNSNGQLTEIAFNAPSRDGAPQHTQSTGFSFTVTGLEAGTSYDLAITAKNENGQEIDKKIVQFTTTGGITTSIEDLHVDFDKPVKVLHDGNIYILRGDHIFDTQGKMVK